MAAGGPTRSLLVNLRAVASRKDGEGAVAPRTEDGGPRAGRGRGRVWPHGSAPSQDHTLQRQVRGGAPKSTGETSEQQAGTSGTTAGKAGWGREAEEGGRVHPTRPEGTASRTPRPDGTAPPCARSATGPAGIVRPTTVHVNSARGHPPGEWTWCRGCTGR